MADGDIKGLSSPLHSTPPKSQEDNNDIPDGAQNDEHCIHTTPTTNHNDHEPIENAIVILLEPTPPSIVQIDNAAESVPSASTNC